MLILVIYKLLFYLDCLIVIVVHFMVIKIDILIVFALIMCCNCLEQRSETHVEFTKSYSYGCWVLYWKSIIYVINLNLKPFVF